MATYALVIDGLVHNIYRGASSVDDFPAIKSHLVECDDSVRVNWIYDGGAFVDPADLAPLPTARQLRRAEYFSVLRVEDGDDMLTVLGDQVDKILAQLYAIVPVDKRTAEFSDLIGKVAAVKQKFPKAPPPQG